MTICIAAICESGQKIVIAADRMFTAPPPISLEFETDERKIEQLSPTCIALISGNSAFATEILESTRHKLGGKREPLIADVADTVKDEYISARSRRINESIVMASLGSDFAAFLAKGGMLPTYLQAQPVIYQQLVAMSQQFNMNLEIIVAGLDRAGAFIARITHPGTLVRLDKLGYDAIGSGGIHALTKLYLGAQTVRRHIDVTLYVVYEAKKAAEVAPGVGRGTDVAVISKDGLDICDDTIMTALEEVYSVVTKSSTPNLDKVMKAYGNSKPKS